MILLLEPNNMYKHFTNSEFKNATPSCSIEDMDEEFMEKVDKARAIAGIPFVINSAYRSEEYELEQGRDGTSSHTKGLALDIKVQGPRQRYLIATALQDVGFTRFGQGSEFIHVDGDIEKDQQVIWTYY